MKWLIANLSKRYSKDSVHAWGHRGVHRISLRGGAQTTQDDVIKKYRHATSAQKVVRDNKNKPRLRRRPRGQMDDRTFWDGAQAITQAAFEDEVGFSLDDDISTGY